MTADCHVLRVPKTQWDFCPSIAAAYVFAVLFAIATLVHLAQALLYRKVYCWAIIMGNLLQFIAYVLRVLSINNADSLGLYSGWFVLIAIAPVWLNAFVYMVMGRMVWNCTSTGKLGSLSAWRFGQVFLGLDILALVIQLYGAATAADTTVKPSTILQGLHTYMGGLGVQQFFICVFLVFSLRLYGCIRGNSTGIQQKQFIRLLCVEYAVIVLITARIIFRLIEYSDGIHSSIPRHEVYQYCLDSLLMLIGSTLFNMVHPGQIMPGVAHDLPSRKDRKLRDSSKQRGNLLSLDSIRGGERV